jgi:hypothetical protein
VAYNKAKYEANKERILELQQQYRERNRENERARHKRYRNQNLDRHAGYERKRRAVKQNLESKPYTAEMVIEMYGADCHICGKEIDLNANRRSGRPGWENGLQIDHLTSLYNAGPDTIENVRPSHGRCNMRKNRYEIEMKVN